MEITNNLKKLIEKNKIFITDNYIHRTKQNILNNKFVSLTILNNGVAFELSGEAQYFNKGEMFDKAKSLPENKDEPCKGVIFVSIKNIIKMN